MDPFQTSEQFNTLAITDINLQWALVVANEHRRVLSSGGR
jgi:hypothetical protein